MPLSLLQDHNFILPRVLSKLDHFPPQIISETWLSWKPRLGLHVHYVDQESEFDDGQKGTSVEMAELTFRPLKALKVMESPKENH